MMATMDAYQMQNYMNEMIRRKERELEYKMNAMQNLPSQDSRPVVAQDAPAKKPKHLNQKLLLIKG